MSNQSSTFNRKSTRNQTVNFLLKFTSTAKKYTTGFFLRHLLSLKDKLPAAAAIIFFAGMMIFYPLPYAKLLELMYWYYLWHKVTFAIVFLYMFLSVPVFVLAATMGYLIVDIIWVVLCIAFKLDINSSPIVDIIFVITLVTIILITVFDEILKRHARRHTL